MVRTTQTGSEERCLFRVQSLLASLFLIISCRSVSPGGELAGMDDSATSPIIGGQRDQVPRLKLSRQSGEVHPRNAPIPQYMTTDMWEEKSQSQNTDPQARSR